MINLTGNKYNVGFTGRHLADIELKDRHGEAVSASFTRITDTEKIAAEAFISSAGGMDYNTIAGHVRDGKDYYAIELDNGRPLQGRIVTIAGVNISKDNGLYVSGLLTAPAYRQDNSKRKLKGGGQVMLGMLSKLANELGLNRLYLKTFAESESLYTDKIGMEEDIENGVLTLEGKEKDRFINELEDEYEMEEIDSKYIDELKSNL